MRNRRKIFVIRVSDLKRNVSSMIPTTHRYTGESKKSAVSGTIVNEVYEPVA